VYNQTEIVEAGGNASAPIRVLLNYKPPSGRFVNYWQMFSGFIYLFYFYFYPDLLSVGKETSANESTIYGGKRLISKVGRYIRTNSLFMQIFQVFHLI